MWWMLIKCAKRYISRFDNDDCKVQYCIITVSFKFIWIVNIDGLYYAMAHCVMLWVSVFYDLNVAYKRKGNKNL